MCVEQVVQGKLMGDELLNLVLVAPHERVEEVRVSDASGPPVVPDTVDSDLNWVEQVAVHSYQVIRIDETTDCHLDFHAERIDRRPSLISEQEVLEIEFSSSKLAAMLFVLDTAGNEGCYGSLMDRLDRVHRWL